MLVNQCRTSAIQKINNKKPTKKKETTVSNSLDILKLVIKILYRHFLAISSYKLKEHDPAEKYRRMPCQPYSMFSLYN